jgi:antitoxin ParD1/3/4
MGASLHVSLPDEMRRFVDRISNGSSRYATPSEYVRDLIRKDMEKMEVYQHLLQGLDEAERGEFVPQEDVDAMFAEFGVSRDDVD